MKKLFFAASVVSAAICAHAAAISWGDGELYDQGGSLAGSDVKMDTFYLGSDATASAAYTYILGLGAAAGSTFVYNNVKDGWLEFTAKGVEYSFEASSTGLEFDGGSSFDDKNGVESGTTYYFATLMKQTVGEDEYYIGNVAAKVSNGKNQTIDSMGSIWSGDTGASAAAVEWQAVPEPFSGSLALLGVGLVALRRKMKKQKKA